MTWNVQYSSFHWHSSLLLFFWRVLATPIKVGRDNIDNWLALVACLTYRVNNNNPQTLFYGEKSPSIERSISSCVPFRIVFFLKCVVRDRKLSSHVGTGLKFLIKFAFIRLWKTTGGLFRCTRFPSSAGKCISLVFSSQSPSCTAFTVPWSGLSNEWRWSWQLHSNWSYTTRRRIQREREELST